MAAPLLRVLCARMGTTDEVIDFLDAKPQRVPHSSRPLRGVGTTDACSAVLDVDVARDLARVERTLLSVAFDVDLALDSA